MWPYNRNCYKLKSNNIELKVMRNKKVTFQISGTTQKGALFGLLLNFKKQLLHIVAPPPQFHWVITGALGTAHVRNGWHCSMNHTRASLCLERWRLFLAVWWRREAWNVSMFCLSGTRWDFGTPPFLMLSIVRGRKDLRPRGESV